ncbi:probable G-protein coupled receptor 158 isoform X2 [Eriocheir sinensis]|uniref:probable G-protein coupled receptor 158 isoform X2 n=1 Tax=Eriocheir sinensis TaxID=95602 RepID=UPI0021C76EFF|nr:probable G-protein coupled receptor 158 isoform X2 [Eriocheir sinensis]
MTGGRRPWLWAAAWACVCVCLALADEEDPLQHEAQVAARDRQLTRVLRLLGVEKQEGRAPEELDDEQQQQGQQGVSEGCTRRTLDLMVPASQLDKFTTETRAALRLANLLNNLFVGVPEGFEPTYPTHVFHALVRAVLEHEPSITSSAVAFLRGEYHAPAEEEEPQEVFGAYGWRRAGSDVATTELAALHNHSIDNPDHQDTKWFTAHTSYSFTRRRINSSMVGGEDGASPAPLTLTRAEDGKWAPEPLFDCGASNSWVLAHSLPFFARADNGLYARLKGVVLVTVPLAKVDLDQCDVDDLLGSQLFAGTHKCDVSTTQCVSVTGMGFRRGGYRCQCHPGYYLPRPDPRYFQGAEIEAAYSRRQGLEAFRCLPCPEGCQQCSASLPCPVNTHALSRLLPACIQAAAVCLCLVLAGVVLKIRKCKVIAVSLWTMLEMVLLGAVVIYCTIFLRFVEPTVTLCMVEPWFRELGFAIFYGAIVLKLYRSLVDHRTRKAHRYVIRDRDLLKYLAGLVSFVTGYLAAWSALMAHLATEGHSLLALGRSPEGLAFTTCKSMWWEYVTEAGELIFVSFGLYLAWQLSKAAGDSGEVGELCERRGLTAALLLELLASTVLYAGRHVLWLRAHPDHAFLAYFARTHLTVTLSLLLLLVPKLWCAGGGGGRELPRRTYSTTEAGHEPRFCDALTNGDLEASDINLSQMDPEEIRAELKRVYTQLEILRTKTMRKDNPHISKRRGGRKATHRRFSLQSFHRHHQRALQHTLDGCEGDMTKTPEESVCSIEGPSVLSVYADGPSDMGTPSILHRSYKL